MRVNGNTLKHAHLRIPTAGDVRDWVKKTFTKELEADAALVVFCFSLLAFAFLSLLKAFNSYHVMP